MRRRGGGRGQSHRRGGPRAGDSETREGREHQNRRNQHLATSSPEEGAEPVRGHCEADGSFWDKRPTSIRDTLGPTAGVGSGHRSGTFADREELGEARRTCSNPTDSSWSARPPPMRNVGPRRWFRCEPVPNDLPRCSTVGWRRNVPPRSLPSYRPHTVSSTPEPLGSSRKEPDGILIPYSSRPAGEGWSNPCEAPAWCRSCTNKRDRSRTTLYILAVR
jgi:hypothetical protein